MVQATSNISIQKQNPQSLLITGKNTTNFNNIGNMLANIDGSNQQKNFDTDNENGYTIHKIKSGETLSHLAVMYGTTVKTIKEANPGLNEKKLQINQEIFIPQKNKEDASNTQKSNTAENKDNNKKYLAELAQAIAATSIDNEQPFSAPLAKPQLSSPILDALLIKETPEAPNSFGKQAISPNNNSALTNIAKNILSDSTNQAPSDTKLEGTDSKSVVVGNTQIDKGITQEVEPTQADEPDIKPKSKEEIAAQVLSYAKGYIMGEEGYESKPYICPAGKRTIGYGHRILEDEKFTSINQAEAEALLEKDIKKAYTAIIDALGNTADKLTEQQLAALVSMTFNSGISGVIDSEYFAMIKKGEFEEAQAKMDAVYGNKKNSKDEKEIKNGLLIRRTEEMLLFGNGKLSPKAQERVLELLNESFNTNYRSIAEAEEKMKSDLTKLETAKKLTKKEKIQRSKLRNIMAFFDAINNPPIFIDTDAKPKLATGK